MRPGPKGSGTTCPCDAAGKICATRGNPRRLRFTYLSDRPLPVSSIQRMCLPTLLGLEKRPNVPLSLSALQAQDGLGF
jgi:hypothetical protein